MKRLEQLPQMTDRALAGLTASDAMKRRIMESAMRPQRRKVPVNRLVPVLSLVLVLAIGLGVGLPALNNQPAQELITTQAAGQDVIGNERSLLDLSTGANLRKSEAPAYRSIWAKGENGNFPLIGVKGRYYRMLTSPKSVSGSLLGDSLGTVAEFTTEPSLSGTDVILSNKAAQGTQVYAVDGMGGTLIAAEVDGSYRLFQRVSFNGSAVRGSESFEDTLQLAGSIAAMELSGVGVIDDAALCEELFATLTDNACYESSSTVSGKQSLMITLDNGVAVQLAVKNDNLSACGTWSCPEFFEEFEAAME